MTTKEPMTAEKLAEFIFDKPLNRHKPVGQSLDEIAQAIKQYTVDLQSQNDDLTQQVSTLLADRAAEHSHLHVLASILAGDKEVNLIEMVELTRELQAEVERLKVTVAGKQYNANILRHENKRLSELIERYTCVFQHLNIDGDAWEAGGGAPAVNWAAHLIQENERLAMELSVAQRDVVGLREDLEYIAVDPCEEEAGGRMSCFQRLEFSKTLDRDDPASGFSEGDFCNPCCAKNALTSTQASADAARGRIELDQTVKVFAAIAATLDNPGTFRHLIYDRLGFGPETYEPLLKAGGLAITNFICERQGQ